VAVVTIGVVLATLSRPLGSRTTTTASDPARYAVGITMLALSLVLTGILGILQERVYKRYGPHWQEGVFYTVRDFAFRNK
jgi:UDP-xylose/UDP-N-acetylglucosamine transporter B4